MPCVQHGDGGAVLHPHRDAEGVSFVSQPVTMLVRDAHVQSAILFGRRHGVSRSKARKGGYEALSGAALASLKLERNKPEWGGFLRVSRRDSYLKRTRRSRTDALYNETQPQDPCPDEWRRDAFTKQSKELS